MAAAKIRTEVKLPDKIRIHTERILSKFAELAIIKREEIYRIWLVTPWITYKRRSKDPLVTLINAVTVKRPNITLITRPPKTKEHQDAIKLLESRTSTVSYTIPLIHAKIYILECDGFRVAFFGSANFTGGGNEPNREIAIDLRTTMQDSKHNITMLINDLLTYVSDLRNDAELITR